MITRSPRSIRTYLCSSAAMSASAECGSPSLPVERARVELEVAGVDDGAGGRVDRQTDAVHDRVRDADGLDAKRTCLETIARADHPQIGRLGEPVLAQALRDERQGEGRAVHGHRYLAEQIRQGADVVLVAVGQDDGAERFTSG